MKAPPLHRMRAAFLRIFFKLLYNQFAWTYDLVAAVVSMGLWKRWIFSVIPHLDGPRILELGHGPGHLQSALHEKGCMVFGLDVSSQMGRLAYRRLCGRNVIPLLVNGYAQFLPFKNESFHQIVATFPTDYIIHPSTLAEISRILIPGGSLIVLPSAWITDRRWFFRLAAWLFTITGQVSPYRDLVARFGTDKRMQAPFLQAGFQLQVENRPNPFSEVLIIQAFKR